VLVVHGLNDWNVKTLHFAQRWERLAGNRVPRKPWLHQGGHRGPGRSATHTLPDGTSWTYKQTKNRWFDHWLWRVRNGSWRSLAPSCSASAADTPPTGDWPDPAARPRPAPVYPSPRAFGAAALRRRGADDPARPPGRRYPRPHLNAGGG
jgi:X-Pro dipeptidyl-peptidase